MKQFVSQLVFLGINLFVALFVWRYYRGLTIPASLKYSTFSPRFWTGSIDACVLWPIGFITSILLSIQLPSFITALLLIIQNLTWLVYTIYMHATYGQTYGKMVCKVKVVDNYSENSISLRQAVLREAIPLASNLVLVGYQVFIILTSGLSNEAILNAHMSEDRVYRILSIVPFLWFIAEILTMLMNNKRRALHDFIAGTVVIRTNI